MSSISNMFPFIKCIEETYNIEGLPLYMSMGREIRKCSCHDKEFVVVSIADNDRFGVVAYKKQIKNYEEKCNYDVAFKFHELTIHQRNSLLEHDIAFIDDGGQVYLPFLGLVLSNRQKSNYNVKVDKIMPATQLVFLYLLYSKGKMYKKEIANKLNLTQTSITRSSNELNAIGILNQEKNGREYYMQLKCYGYEAYTYMKPYLINPVKKKICVAKKDVSIKIRAGESALADITMLNEPEYITRAVYKSLFDEDKVKVIDPKWDTNEQYECVELWKYDPNILAKNRRVDIVSLACSFMDEKDERISKEINKMLEDKEW